MRTSKKLWSSQCSQDKALLGYAKKNGGQKKVYSDLQGGMNGIAAGAESVGASARGWRQYIGTYTDNMYVGGGRRKEDNTITRRLVRGEASRVPQIRTRPDTGVLKSRVRTYFCPDI